MAERSSDWITSVCGADDYRSEFILDARRRHHLRGGHWHAHHGGHHAARHLLESQLKIGIV